jgi:teichuronic acid biosynthesis glycosyltransferase TuaH
MATIAKHAGSTLPHARVHLALAVADACWFTTENLFRELRDDRVATLLLKCLDYRNAWRRGEPPWTWHRPLCVRGRNLWTRDLILPPGWMKRYPKLGMRPIGRAIGRWRARYAERARLALVMTYPHYLFLRELTDPDISVYFNLDDYTLYWPAHAKEIARLECEAVRASNLTVCVSRVRAEELRARVPEAAGRVHHLPHGAPSATLGAAPQAVPAPPPDDMARLPRPRIGYVGSLEDRVDWELLECLSRAVPGASIVLVGRLAPNLADAGEWQAACQRCLARPNVHALGWRGQEAIAAYQDHGLYGDGPADCRNRLARVPALRSSLPRGRGCRRVHRRGRGHSVGGVRRWPRARALCLGRGQFLRARGRAAPELATGLIRSS